MRRAVISDVHGNMEALRGVLRDIRKRKADSILFLGDAVGYGPDPNDCVRTLKAECSVLLAGNHDWAAIGLAEKDHFNPYARAAVEWTAEVLETDCIGALRDFALTHEAPEEGLFLVHATPKEPEKWHYLFSLWDAGINFGCFDEKICLVGHSHQPLIIERLPSGEMVAARDGLTFGETERYIINVGSVGQPRDGDPRACYAILGEDGVTMYRVAYDVAETQKKMGKAGLPSPLIERLSRGL
jgi:predicted phosphodiesterase